VSFVGIERLSYLPILNANLENLEKRKFRTLKKKYCWLNFSFYIVSPWKT